MSDYQKYRPMNQGPYVRVNKLPLVAALACEGVHYTETEKDESGRLIFIYERSKDLEEFMDEFWNKRVRVEPLDFAQAMRTVKDAIHRSRMTPAE